MQMVVVVIMIMVVAKIEGIFEVTIITTTLSTFRSVKRYKNVIKSVVKCLPVFVLVNYYLAIKVNGNKLKNNK